MQTKNEAIASYLKNATKVHGLGSVILLPEFAGSDESGWAPVAGNGVRTSDKMKEGQAFIRLGSVVLGDGMKVVSRFTNDFQPTAQLADTLDMLGIVPGSKVPGKLCVEESMRPYRKTNSEQDIKWADQKAGIMCTFTGTTKEMDAEGKLVDVIYDSPAPIYRRTVHKMDINAADTLITHTNRSQISAHASAKWAVEHVKAVSPAVMDAGAIELRKAELKAIPKAKRTPEQVAELADLLEA